MSGYTPSMDEILGQWVADAFRDCHRRPEETEHLSIGALRDAADRAIAAHDRELREQVAREYGIGDLTSRPLRDAQDEITRLESLVHYLRRENRRLENTIARGEDQTND